MRPCSRMKDNQVRGGNLRILHSGVHRGVKVILFLKHPIKEKNRIIGFSGQQTGDRYMDMCEEILG